MLDAILEVKNLSVAFSRRGNKLEAVRGVSLDVFPGEIVGIVGESGSGKSLTMKSVMGILPESAQRKADVLRLGNRNLLTISQDELYKVRGSEMTMIFQDPMTALNPLQTIGRHLEEVILRHKKISKSEAREQSIRMLNEVGIPDAETRLKQYPHEFSGGMRQRVLIAMALSCEPKLLIADEPTTALDVTIQAQILDLLKELRDKHGTSIVLITHDMGVIATLCSRVYVMYNGKIMESASVGEIFYEAQHPYTKALLNAIPDRSLASGTRLKPIEGSPPSLTRMPKGCPFVDRCKFALEECRDHMPELISYKHNHMLACHLLKASAEEK